MIFLLYWFRSTGLLVLYMKHFLELSEKNNVAEATCRRRRILQAGFLSYTENENKQYITVDNGTTLLYTVYNRREHMKIIINNTSMVPIYEQIMEQIKAQIISGELKENDILPSVRTMAKELKISALTVKKAYDNLEAEGMTVTVHGKGTYVAASNTQLMEEERRKEVEADLEAAIQKGRRCGMKEEEIRSLFELIMEDE